MAKRTTINTLATARHPNFKAFGIKPPEEITKLLGEHDQLALRARDLNAAIQEVQAQVTAEENAAPRKRAEAARAGTAVVSELTTLQEKLGELEAARQDLTRAAQLVEKDLQKAIEEHKPALLAQISELDQSAMARIHELNQELRLPEWQREAVLRLKQYLQDTGFSGGHTFLGIGSPPE